MHQKKIIQDNTFEHLKGIFENLTHIVNVRTGENISLPYSLRERYEAVVDEYIQLFQKKHGYDFDFWIGDSVGEIASFCQQYYLNFLEIKFDIDNNCPKDLIFKWQQECVDNAMKPPKKQKVMPNYENYYKLNKTKTKCKF